MMFAHGFGCDPAYVAFHNPRFEIDYKIILFDYVGAARSDKSAYNYREQVFQLFRKLHKKEGQGIGLALCKKIAENHHGNITISSDENEGTTVELFLPVNAGGVWV